MILRSLTKHVNDQNWFAVALDFFIVVVGVFIGIQVSNWNASLQDHRDGRIYLERIHKDLMNVEAFSDRVRVRRVDLIDILTQAAGVLFAGDENAVLTEAECLALATSHYYNIKVTPLPSVDELMSAGRLAILDDAALTGALVKYQQDANELRASIDDGRSIGHDLPILDPLAIRSEPVFDTVLGEMQGRYTCDVPRMRANPLFMNAVSENVDVYDAYLRDGLRPWNEQLRATHTLIDAAMGVHHEPKDQP
jgi:hypothetical protein